MHLGMHYKTIMEKIISPLGRQLKYWRKRKLMSQLDLSCRSGVTTRHLSFIETGRSRPGKNVILRLAQSLRLPLREQNEMLKLAGLIPVWQETNLQSKTMEAFQGILEQMIEKHEPFPAYVLDRWWNLIMANPTAASFFSVHDDKAGPVNTIEVLIKPGPIREMLENRDDVLSAIAKRLKKQIDDCAGDKKLEELLRLVESDISHDIHHDDGDNPVVYTNFNIGGKRISTISTIAKFIDTKDVILNELRVELIYPADEQSRLFFEE